MWRAFRTNLAEKFDPDFLATGLAPNLTNHKNTFDANEFSLFENPSRLVGFTLYSVRVSVHICDILLIFHLSPLYVSDHTNHIFLVMTMTETKTYKTTNTNTKTHRQRQIQSASKTQRMLY